MHPLPLTMDLECTTISVLSQQDRTGLWVPPELYFQLTRDQDRPPSECGT